MNANGIDLNLMLAFEALLRERSVSRAAARLSIGQPAMSNALSRLRAVFGDPLFERKGHAMVPTSRALALAQPIERSLTAFREALAPVEPFDPATSTRKFRISGGDYALAVLLPGLIPRLRAEAPSVDLRFRFVEKDQAFDLLDTGSLDFVLGVFNDVPKRFSAQVVFREEFFCLMRASGRAARSRLTAASYAAYPHVLVTERGDETGAVDQALGLLGLSRRVAVTVPNVSAIRSLLLESDLIATIGQRLCSTFVADKRLVVRKLPITLPQWEMRLIRLRKRVPDAAVDWFAGLLLESAQKN